jgi:hypothetical protein
MELAHCSFMYNFHKRPAAYPEQKLNDMEGVQLKIDEKGYGHFYIAEGDEQLGEMEVSISGSNLTVYHTEVSEKAEGKGYAKMLLKEMVRHARMNDLKVIPLCPFVHAQFKRHPEEYADVWNKDEDR